MRRLRPLLSILPLLLTASAAMAVDYRWTPSYAQGTLEAIIHNRNDSSVTIYCPEGFALQEIQYLANSNSEKLNFFALVDALVASKQRSFVVEFPKYETAETFSLLDARKSLGEGKKSILAGCGGNER